jgi:hypothetical protein
VINVFPIPTTTTIDYPHQKTHEGRYFSGGYYDSSVANNGTLDLLVQSSSTEYSHIKFSAVSSGNATVQLYTGTTVSAAGTGVTMSNHNRASAKAFSGTVTHTPTVTGVGTQINGTGFIAGGPGGGEGGDFGFSNEFILDKSTNYLFRVTNVSGSASKISSLIQGYQPTL